jgi:GcrA cell cycle regulator
MTEKFWTPERVSILTASWNAGHSAREIASAMGNGVTRNSIVSKVHRLGLKMHQSSNSWRDKPSKRAAP